MVVRVALGGARIVRLPRSWLCLQSRFPGSGILRIYHIGGEVMIAGSARDRAKQFRLRSIVTG